ncbi:Crp/Fnr family transcriptional regulator [Sphingomonas xanthus]|uniref:Crp/Fnr family transcriptional regulator n=1 Tax=Sphingomonas xanthus TaxID=2594473 RepID=A0A516IR28_9SPHN|nr:Crp/Fnr family transcriptional regulator [Sphingomonas xanthus]QDP19360.1 Crp/Fnr family transcriptional regulator [Sphingomonas xanthus]
MIQDLMHDLSEAFAGNRLLSTTPADLRARLKDAARPIDLDNGEILFRRGGQVAYSTFPFGPTMVSLVVDLDNGRSVEVATIGREGAVGGIVSCGNVPAFSRAEVMVAGPALQIPMKLVEEAKAASPQLNNLFCRYADYLLGQVMQTVACNSFHPIEARAARWLLTAQDRAGSRLELTQESLAGLLGVQRTTVNAVTRQLQDEGLITTRRSQIEIKDRSGLMARSCECYARMETFFGDMIGPEGTGGVRPSAS